MKDSFSHKANSWDSEGKIIMTGKFVSEVLNNTSLNNEMNLLELGTGTGLVGLRLASKVKHITLLDASASMLEILKQKLEITPRENVTVINDIIENFKEDNIDLVFSFMAMHHVEDIDSAVKTFRRIIKKGGHVIIGDLLPEDGSFHGDEIVPHLGFEIENLSHYFTNNGFKIKKAYPYSSMSKPDGAGKIRTYEQFILIATKI
jgi:ubiquinone/menaquinone biosynthesis C-methylase UbiE